MSNTSASTSQAQYSDAKALNEEEGTYYAVLNDHDLSGAYQEVEQEHEIQQSNEEKENDCDSFVRGPMTFSLEYSEDFPEVGSISFSNSSLLRCWHSTFSSPY